MASRDCLLMLLLLLILSQNHNRILAFLHKPLDWECPEIRLHCLFDEVDSCTRHQECKSLSKCCPLSCGMKCLGYTEDPCEEVIQSQQCAHTLTRWYFDIKENECFPMEYGTCTQGKNNFQSYDVCKRTCLAFGHGVPIKFFEIDGEPFTLLV